jgi:uncharacterized protein YjbJ (UPF0337 family)
MQKRSNFERALMLWILSFGALVFWSAHLVTSQERLVSVAQQPSLSAGAGISSARYQSDGTSCTSDRLQDAHDILDRSVDSATGKVVGDPRLEIEGAGQRLKGEAQGAVGDAKDAVKKVIDKVSSPVLE